ncbi:MAG: N-acetylmuramoyl-L-alanine amidase [Defluviitaleaceae bacterium]|nr:N-acetylmuramoyl-L-alanine amidase [Defluviitaleaceae bacterium]
MDNTTGRRYIFFKIAGLFMAAIMLATVFPPLVKTADAAVPPGHNPYGAYSGEVFSAEISSTDSFTYLTFATSERVTFSFRYVRESVSVTIHRASRLPRTVHIGENPLFTSGSWNGNTLTLALTTIDGFMGYHGYYDHNGDIVVRFRNPPSSMEVARIAIDPGHGGRDRGAEGFRRDMPEAVINQQIAHFLADELRRRGATVFVLDTSRGMELTERVKQAEQFNADIFISIHCNASARNPAARGTEVHFLMPFSQILAGTASRNVATNLGTLNRGALQRGFVVLRSTQFVSILVETGFMTNREEYEKLINPFYQQQVATGIASAVEATIKHTYPGTGRVFR